MDAEEGTPKSMMPFFNSNEESPQKHLDHEADDASDDAEDDCQVSAVDERDTKRDQMEVNLSKLLLNDTKLSPAGLQVGVSF